MASEENKELQNISLGQAIHQPKIASLSECTPSYKNSPQRSDSSQSYQSLQPAEVNELGAVFGRKEFIRKRSQFARSASLHSSEQEDSDAEDVLSLKKSLKSVKSRRMKEEDNSSMELGIARPKFSSSKKIERASLDFQRIEPEENF